MAAREEDSHHLHYLSKAFKAYDRSFAPVYFPAATV